MLIQQLRSAITKKRLSASQRDQIYLKKDQKQANSDTKCGGSVDSGNDRIQ